MNNEQEQLDREYEQLIMTSQRFQNLWLENYGEESKSLVPENEKLMKYLMEGGFFTAPASTKYHGAHPGGLYKHSRAVYKHLNYMTKQLNLQWNRPESPFIVGMFHDLCKCDQYILVQGGEERLENGLVVAYPQGFHYEYNKKTLIKGHGAKSVMILSQFLTLTEEEMLCIRYHMGAYETDDWDEFDRAVRKYPTVLYTHTADMLASKVDNT